MTKNLARLLAVALLCAAADGSPAAHRPVPLDKSWRFCSCRLNPQFGHYHTAPLRTWMQYDNSREDV